MAAQKVRKGKRRWYPIYAPALFDNQLIGETYVWDTESIPQKFVTVNLSTLVNNSKKQNVDVHFKVVALKEGKGICKTIGLEMQLNSVRRLARKGRSKVSDSFLAKTKKGEYIRIKPILMTRTRANNDIQTALRLRMRTLVREVTAKYNFETIVNDCISMRLQKYLKNELTKIFPTRSVDIRFIKYEKLVEGDEESVEETDYLQQHVAPFEQDAVSESMASLREEVEEALAADSDENNSSKKKRVFFDEEDDEEEDEE